MMARSAIHNFCALLILRVIFGSSLLLEARENCSGKEAALPDCW